MIACRQSLLGLPMPVRVCLAVVAVALCAAGAAAQAPGDAAREMVGAWEISNAARDKTCPVTFKLDPGAGGFKLDLDDVCGTAFPSLKDVTVWIVGPNDSVRLLNSKGAVVLDFMEVEAHMYEAERKGEGLFFMRTQAAIKAATVSPEQVFGEWVLLQEFEKPLCKLTLSNASAGGESYKITVKPGCDASVANIELSTWRLDRDGLLLTGRGGSWRFSESDATTWERIPASADPLVLMRQ
jgi:Protease inhibitor Inh